MKKVIFSLALLLASVSSFADAAIKVPGVWGFAVGSTQGTYYRAILEQANKEQNKYEFQFEHKPGAGGAIASRYVFDQQPKLAILAHSAAFYVRPNLYPDTPYSFDQFKPVMVMGFAPATLVTKQKTLEQLLAQKKLSIGTAGTGSSTHLMAETFVKGIKNAKDKDIVMVHFKDTNEAFTSVMGGHTDATFEFLGDAKAKANVDIALVGITGKNQVDGIDPLSKSGFKDMEGLSGIFAIYVPVATPAEVTRELQAILLKAEKSDKVQELYKKDYTSKDAYMQTPSDLNNWYQSTVRQYRSLTKDIKVN
jgi:tripartite-type tricarboxylate transporter receptor subunit TctC